MEVKKKEVTKPKEKPRFLIGPAQVDRIEGSKLYSAGETYPVKIPRFQAENIKDRLEKGEVWHVTPWPRDIKKETGLVLAVFDHKPTPDELTLGVVEEFIEESLQNRASVELQGKLTNFKDLEFNVLDNRGERTFNIGGLAEYMNDCWRRSQKREKPPEAKEEKLEEEEWGGNWITVPKGTLIRHAPLSVEGIHAETRETTKRKISLPVISTREEDRGRIAHFNIKAWGGGSRGWVTMVRRGKKREIL